MALVIFQDDSKDIPFLDEYLENTNVKDGTEFEILGLRVNKKGNGFVIETKSFITFRFKNDSVIKQLMEAFEIWVERGHGAKLVLIIDRKAKGFHNIGADFEFARYWFYDERKKSYQQDKPDSSTTTGNTKSNPFLQVLPLPGDTPQDESQSSPSPSKRKRTS